MTKPSILIVDDDKLQRQLLSDILQETFTVMTADDGNAAIDTLGKQSFVAVLCDYMMPGITGVEVLAKCLASQPNAVRILVTATDDVATLKDAINVAHVHRFVVKPVRELELPRMIHGAIREASLEKENLRLLTELKQAVAQLQERERELENELRIRTDELKEVMGQFIDKA